MCSSDEEDKDFALFGTPLHPYEEDAFPSKKPISIENQVARDEHGRRRFHGAFTGGFSAGFYNTVGSLEGWTPAEFKSSRSDKASTRARRPEDFMDDEDVGEFGIAPRVVRAKRDFDGTDGKRKRHFADEGPIPGEPVLDTFLRAGNETIGYFLMKNLGSKRRRHEITSSEGETSKIYGCQMPPNATDLEMSSHEIEYTIHEIYQTYLSRPKSDTFGMGYVGLDKSDRRPEFVSDQLRGREKNNKKFSITGQAFGVGAFEDDDEDIYVREDMSRYDFELTSEEHRQSEASSKSKLIFGLFVSASTIDSKKQRTIKYPPPDIPVSFTGKYKKKKSRFEPIATNHLVETANKSDKLDALSRAALLGEKMEFSVPKPKAAASKTESENVSKLDRIFPGPILDRFVSAQNEDGLESFSSKDKQSSEEKSAMLHGTSDMQNAVKMKMFGPLTRTVEDWQPHSFLCKKFNVPEPKSELSVQKPKKGFTKHLIFEYQKHVDSSDQCVQAGLPTSSSPPENLVAPSKQDDKTETIVNEDKIGGESTTSPEQPTTTDRKDVALLDPTEKINAAENMDLFKAVFLSSDEESDNEPEDTVSQVDRDRKDEMASAVLSDALIPEIKTWRRGILSDICAVEGMPETISAKVEVIPEKEDGRHDATYGPRLPDNAVRRSGDLVSSGSVADEQESEWIEKDACEIGTKKRHKKHHKKEKRKKKDKKKRIY